MHECQQQETIKDLCEFKGMTEKAVENIEKSIKNIEENHLVHIYHEIKKMAGKPSWLILSIITFLSCALVLVARELLVRI